MKDSILTKRQVKTLTKQIMVDGKQGRIEVSIRYDDQCGNGHNSFAITGTIFSHPTSSANRYYAAGGCLHEEIVKHFPELKPFIKWHLTSSDGPTYYVANTLYHARDTDTEGRKAGDVTKYQEVLLFNDLPIEFKQMERGFFEFLRDCKSDFSDLDIEPIEHDNDTTSGYQFDPKYTFKGFANVWHYCPFDKWTEAHNFMLALQNNKPHFKQVPCEWAKAVKPNLKAARSSAVWPDATLEQLQDEEQLKARLPALMEQFTHDMELLGFIY